MGKSSTVRVERPPVSSESTYTAIPFGPKIRTQRAAVVKVLAAVTRSSWVDPDTRRRITMASNRHLAALAAVADPQTIAKHLAALAEVGAVTIEHTGDHRVVVVHERAEGIGDQFVVLTDSHPAWSFRPRPFSLFLAVRSFDFQNTGRCWPKNVSLAKFLNWSERAVKRTMAELRGAGAVTTVSVFNPSSVTRKRMIYAPNPTPNPEPAMPGGYEKVDPLCDDARVRKSGPYPYEKVDPTPTKKWTLPLRKSGPLKTNSEDEFLRATASTNQPREKFTGQSESEPGAELAEVVVVDELASTDTNPEPKPQPAGPPTPDIMAEVVTLLAKSRLERDEQERYLKAARSLADSENPPPIAWHHHSLDVQPSSGTKSLAGVVIARLKAWTTTPPEERAMIVEQVTMRDSEVIAKRLKSAKFWYEGFLGDLKAGRTVTPAKVREKWERYNAALKAAGQPAVQLDNAVLHAEQHGQRPTPPPPHIPNVMPRRVKTPNENTLTDFWNRLADLPIPGVEVKAWSDRMHEIPTDIDPAAYVAALERILTEAMGAVPPPPPPVDPAELERRRRERAERERVEAAKRERDRIEAEQEKEVTSRIKAFENRALMLMSTNHGGSLDDAITRWRSTTLPAKRAEIEAEVRAEFAPKFAALAPTRKSPTPPPGQPAIPAMVPR